ncbi:MAG: permease [Candidatus Margulisbacteria bacterium]|nr:permease [Candidatus Margulisiibacteriota bacterium]MBU1729596.1 permease [Candidatus Margulisiibacteriota bacterium]MBU1956021.1 permease [Candidatus Margulisiibacteriota bacterium]
MKERTKFLLMVLGFLLAYYIPFTNARVQSAIMESFLMLQEYVQLHVLTCLIPAFFIAGAISVFISQAAVLKYFGAKANKVLSYGVASVSGSILAVCSCTVLPLFAGIWKRGAGLGPAIAFLYSGPAINILAIILTARVLGWQLGLARALGAVSFSVIIGLIMAFIYRHEEKAKHEANEAMFNSLPEEKRPLSKTVVYFMTMILVLLFATWTKTEFPSGLWNLIFSLKWYLAGLALVVLAWQVFTWFDKDERKTWVESTWEFAKQIFPLLFMGVLAAGFLMGRPGTNSGIIPSRYIEMLVGGNSLWANLFASVSGALMYFATLTEIPILQGLLGAGMGKGPALALLLAGPALSLPNMLVIRSVVGTRKMLVYVSLVIIMSTIAGMVYGYLF